jgi:hypothetical protein
MSEDGRCRGCGRTSHEVDHVPCTGPDCPICSGAFRNWEIPNLEAVVEDILERPSYGEGGGL